MQTLLCLRSDALLKGQCIMMMMMSVTFILYRQLSFCITSFAFVFSLLILKSWVSYKRSKLLTALLQHFLLTCNDIFWGSLSRYPILFLVYASGFDCHLVFFLSLLGEPFL